MSYGSPYGSLYGGSSIVAASASVQSDVDENANAIAFPFQFTAGGDVKVVPEEVGVNNDVQMSVFIREGGIPLFPIGVGIEDFVFDFLDFPDQVFLADRIAESIRLGVPFARVMEEQVQFDDSDIERNKMKVVVPYSNLKTGKDEVAILAVPRQRIDQ